MTSYPHAQQKTMPKPTSEELRTALKMMDVTFADCIQAFALDNDGSDEKYIAAAVERYMDDDHAFDDITLTSKVQSGQGAWVLGWFWVEVDELELGGSDG